MQFHHHQLANGLQIVGETNPSARSVAMGFFVKTGSRDEPPELNGVTHFLEHMIYKGTERRDAHAVNRDFDAIGSHPNAYTSEENTVFHAACLPEYLPGAVEILSDILRPSLRVQDFDMEKNVILEEIGMYHDEPWYTAYEAAKQAFFGRHPLGRSVLGSRESITALTREQMYDYFRRRYVAGNITAVAAGNYDWATLVRVIEQYCSHWENGPAPREQVQTQPGTGFQVLPRETIVQEHAYLLSAGPPAASDLRYPAGVLANVIGDDRGSRLYWALEDPGLVDNANMEFHEYDGAGAFYTYISGDARCFQDSLHIALEVLKDVCKKGITEEELQTAKSKICSRIVRGSEKPMGRMQSVGYYWTYLQKYRTVDEELAAIDAVTTRTVREVLDIYPLDQVSAVALGPLDKAKLADR